MTHNPSTGEWYYSKTGCIEVLRRLLYGLKSITQEELSSSLRSAFAQYLLREPDSKVICHKDNYSKLTFVEQLFTPFTVTKNGYLRLTVRAVRHIYVVFDSNFHRKNTENFVHSSTQNAGTIYKHAGISKTIPYDTLHKYLLESFNKDDYWFDHNTFLIDERYSVSKNLYIENPASIAEAKNFGWFVGYERENKLTSTELADIKKFNKFEKEVEEANVKGFEDGSAREHSYFVYDNQNLTRETFISELNKTIHLVGAITFFDVIPKSGKVNLINLKNKLKFDVVKNNEIASFNFNISHTNAKNKIDFKKKK